MSIRRRSRVVAYVLSLFVLGAAVWLPTTAMAQLVPSGGGSFAGGAVTGATSFLDGANFQIKNTADPTKIVQFSAASVTTGNTVTPITFGGTTAATTVSLAGQFLANSSWNVNSTGDLVGYGTSPGARLGWNNAATAALGATPDTSLRRLAAGVITQSPGTTTGLGSFLGGGANVASADPLPVPTGIVFHVTGTTSFTNITTTNMVTGACFTMIFDGILTVTDGGNMKLSANYTTSADDTLTVCYDSSSFFEVARSVN